MEPEKPLAMKTYRILLRSLGAVFVDAENCSETETTIAFYRGGLVSAEYPRAMVKEVTEMTGHQGRGGHSSAT